MKTVNILGLTYEIIEVDVVNKSIPRSGEINFVEQVIKIDKTLKADRKQITLMHEIVHGIFEHLAFTDLIEDEQVVQGIAIALHQILKAELPTFS